jgi:hypothetical protein
VSTGFPKITVSLKSGQFFTKNLRIITGPKRGVIDSTSASKKMAAPGEVLKNEDWQHLIEAFCNQSNELDFTLQLIQTMFEEFGMHLKI